MPKNALFLLIRKNSQALGAPPPDPTTAPPQDKFLATRLIYTR